MSYAFRNRQDVLSHFGAADEDSLSRRVYKETSCGAWARFGRRSHGYRARAFVIKLRRGINDGIYLAGVRRLGGKSLPKEEWPKEVYDYVLVKPGQTKSELKYNELLRLPTDNIRKVHWLDNLTCYLTVNLLVAAPEKDGLLLGSIVEGSDAEVGLIFLPFPFGRGTLEAALNGIEERVKELEV